MQPGKEGVPLELHYAVVCTAVEDGVGITPSGALFQDNERGEAEKMRRPLSGRSEVSSFPLSLGM